MGKIGYKKDSTIELEEKIKSYIDENEIFWTHDLRKYLGYEDGNKNNTLITKYVKALCSENYIQPCDKQGNHTQYIKV